jgi:hypothetical protein
MCNNSSVVYLKSAVMMVSHARNIGPVHPHAMTSFPGGESGRGVKLTTKLYLVSTVRFEVTSAITHMPSWHTRGKLLLSLSSSSKSFSDKYSEGCK